MKNVRITKKIVRDTMDAIRTDIDESKSAASNDDNPLYGRFIAEAKGALRILECVIDCGYPMNSKKVKDIVAKYR